MKYVFNTKFVTKKNNTGDNYFLEKHKLWQSYSVCMIKLKNKQKFKLQPFFLQYVRVEDWASDLLVEIQTLYQLTYAFIDFKLQQKFKKKCGAHLS